MASNKWICTFCGIKKTHPVSAGHHYLVNVQEKKVINHILGSKTIKK